MFMSSDYSRKVSFRCQQFTPRAREPSFAIKNQRLASPVEFTGCAGPPTICAACAAEPPGVAMLNPLDLQRHSKTG